MMSWKRYKHVSGTPYYYKDALFFHDKSGTWQTWTDSTQRFNGGYQNSSAALNDWVEYKVFADTTTHTFNLICITTDDSAIITVYYDGVSKGTIDLYSATATKNVLKTISGIAFGSTGVHTIRIKATGQNASSLGYYMYLTAIWME